MTRVIGARRWLDDLHPRGWTLLATATFGLGGLRAATVLARLVFGQTYTDPTGPDAVVLVVGSGIGGFVLGGLFWWRLVEIPGVASTYRGGGAGVLTGLLANFVAWAVHSLYTLASVGMGGTPVEVLATMGSLVLVVGGTSKVVTGLVTGPGGGAIGFGLAKIRRRSLGGPPSGPAPAEPTE